MSGRARNIIGQLNSNLSNNFSISHTFRQIVWIKWLFCWHYVDNSVFLPVFTPFYPLFKAKHYLITNVCHSDFTHRATRLLYQTHCLKPFCMPIGAQKMLYLFPTTKWFEPRRKDALSVVLRLAKRSPLS